MSNQMLTLSRRNQFSFRCPVLNSEVQMRGCVMVRDMVYESKKLNTRRGCQACIRSGKCPAAEIVRRTAFGTPDMTDHCASLEPVVGKLPADVLERVRKVVVKESDLMAFNVVLEERETIAASGPRIDAQIATAPRETTRQSRVIKSAAPAPKRRLAEESRQVPSAHPATTNAKTVSAAVTGDLSAAINN